MSKPATPIIDRITVRVDLSEPEGCWPWLGSSDPRGYGRIAVKKVPRTVYRVLWEEVVGPVDEGLELDHLCRNPRCCNPDHLEPVTHAENVRRGLTKTHCIRGHEYTPENTYRPPGGTPPRQCRQCSRIREAKRVRTYGATVPA